MSGQIKQFGILGYSHLSVRFHYPQLLQLYPNFSRQFIVFQVLISLQVKSIDCGANESEFNTFETRFIEAELITN